jgi:F0F1-type ATP synthase delta subunit
MSFHKKIITTYSKSLFQKINNENLKKNSCNLPLAIPEIVPASSFDLDTLLSSQKTNVPANIYVVGEELSFLSSILESSTKIKSFFNNPTLLEEQKCKALLTIFQV